MRRPLALLLLLAATAATPARAATAAEIVLTLRYDTTCASDTSCEATLSGVSCLERAFGDPCTVDPVTVPLAAAPRGSVCTLAAYTSAVVPPVLVVHTTTFGDVPVRITTFVAHGSVAALAGQTTGTRPTALVAAGFAGGTVTEVVTRTCPDVTDGRLTGALVLAAL